MMNYRIPEGFLWGGAVAANQCEGAWNVDDKGPSSADCMTGGTLHVKREYTHGVEAGKYYPSHEAIDFYHHYKEDVKLLLRWDLNVLEPVLTGRGFFR